MKKGQNIRYEKDYFQRLNSQRSEWWRYSNVSSKNEKRNTARKSKKRK